MFLLRLGRFSARAEKQDNLHSNMFLLRRKQMRRCRIQQAEFTFQYVSIKTLCTHPDPSDRRAFTFQYVSIKTQSRIGLNTTRTQIYIPICFY